MNLFHSSCVFMVILWECCFDGFAGSTKENQRSKPFLGLVFWTRSFQSRRLDVLQVLPSPPKSSWDHYKHCSTEPSAESTAANRPSRWYPNKIYRLRIDILTLNACHKKHNYFMEWSFIYYYLSLVSTKHRTKDPASEQKEPTNENQRMSE